MTKIQISLLQLRLPSDPRRSFLAAARHAFSERGIQNNRAEGRGDHTLSAGGVPLRGHKGSSKGGTRRTPHRHGAHARRLRSPRRSLPPLLCLNPPPSPVASVCVCLIIWLPEYFREAAPSRRLTKIQISLLQLGLPSDPRKLLSASAKKTSVVRGLVLRRRRYKDPSLALSSSKILGHFSEDRQS